MARKTDIGPRLYQYALAAAVLNFTPIFDRAALIRRIVIDNASASDVWTVTVGGRELMRFRVDTVGNQRLLQVPTTGSAWAPNFFDYCRHALGLDPSIPVPQGITLTIASVGGATADVLVEGVEVDTMDVNSSLLNHYTGSTFLLPIVGRVNAAIAAVGTLAFDTQEAPAWVPNIVTGAPLPVGWLVEVFALFLEGEGRNTFSGAANHTSITQDVRWFRNGEQLLSRPSAAAANNGIPNVGSAAAAGSANSVFGQRSGVFPPFQLSNDDDDSVLDIPLVFRGGDLSQLQLEVTGDVTGGADYSHAHQVLIARVSRLAA